MTACIMNVFSNLAIDPNFCCIFRPIPTIGCPLDVGIMVFNISKSIRCIELEFSTKFPNILQFEQGQISANVGWTAASFFDSV